MNTSIESLLLILLGWALGMFSPFIVDAIKRRLTERDLRASFHVELDELRYRLAASAHHIRMITGEINRASLEWFRSVACTYAGPQRTSETVSKIDAFLKFTDEELQQLAEREESSFDGAVTLKKFDSLMLSDRDSIAAISCDVLRRKLLQVRTSIGFLNEEIDSARYYARLTFSPSLSEENHAIAVENLRNTYKNVLEQMESVVKQVGDLPGRSI